MTSGTVRLLVWALAAVTALVLLVTSMTLVGQWRQRAASMAATGAGAGPVLERHGVRLRLPEAAEVLPTQERLLYRGADGRVAAAVRGAALLVPGACPEAPGSSRGFVGVVGSRRTSAVAHHRHVAAWASGLAAALGERPQEVEVADTRGPRTDLVAAVRVDGVCQPERVRASLLTLPVGGRSATVVLVRDVGPADAIDDATAELLLAAAEGRSG